MDNNIYISFSADNSSTDSWSKEFEYSFRITLEKISSFSVNVNVASENGNDSEQQLKKADIAILVFNGFVSDSFAKDLRVLEINHQDFLNAGKEIYVVVKSGKFSSIIPVYLRKFTQYNFFDVNIRTNEMIEYSPFLKGEKENKFWSKLTDLAYDVKMFLDVRNGKRENGQTFNVYLAEVSRDQALNKEILKREFLLSDYTVMPVKPLPNSYREYHEAAAELIKSADFSIHIMGDVYGDSPSGSDYSYPEIQNKIITELLSKPGNLKDSFYRFVWLPPNLEPYDEKQIQYLKRLRRELTDSKSGEIIQCSIEEFKELIIQKVSYLTGYSHFNTPVKEEEKLILITDSSNEAVFDKVENQLKLARKNYEVIDLSKVGEMLPLKTFRQKLHMAKGAILVNSNSNSKWLQGMLGLTIKNLFPESKQNKKSIATIASRNNKSVIDFDALKIEFIPIEDIHLGENIGKFLIQN